MAQEFHKYYQMLMREAYSSENYMSMLAIKNNSKRYIEIARPIANGVEYKLDIPKRLKPKPVTLGTSTAAALGMLDNFQEAGINTITLTTTTPHSIGIKYYKTDPKFFGKSKEFPINVLRNSINAVSFFRMEEIIETMVAGKAASPVSTTDPWINIAKDIEEIVSVVDDFIYSVSRDKVFVWINPRYALNLAKEKGVTFRNEVPVFETGLKAKESINGSPMFRNGSLQAITVANKNIAYIVFALDAILFDYIKPNYVEQKWPLNNFLGYVFFDLKYKVFDNRIIVRTFTDKTKPTVKA